MLTKPRWEAEVRVMNYAFPKFEPFAVPGRWAGFRGWLRGKRTGRLYEVLIQASIAKYPNEEPWVYMNPHPERHHWIGGERLWYLRRGHVWKPAEDTFAQVLIIVVKYVDDFDGRG
jgi:hypothetical protein